MGRLMAIDLGRKRCGIAVTDSLRLMANGLDVVSPSDLEQYLKDYFSKEIVDKVIVGYPIDMKGNPSDSMKYITPVLNRLRKVFSDIDFELVDERFTSRLAHMSMIEGGMKKSHRRIKENADIMAAAIILNDYLESRKYKTTI